MSFSRNILHRFQFSLDDLYVALGISLLWTALVVQFGLIHGKLSMEVGFDDSIYMNGGYYHLQKLYQSGDLFGLLKDVFRAHSPWANLQAVVSFAVFGPHNWAPYIFNFFAFGLFIFALWIQARALTRPLGVLLLFWVLTINLSYLAISEFRPDFFNGLMAAIGGFLLVGAYGRDPQERKVTLYLASFSFALALFIKPTFFANSFFIWSSAIIFYLLASAFVREGESIRDILKQRVRELLVPVLMAMAFALPVFLIRFEYYLSYLWINSFGADASIWRIDGGLKGSFNFFISGWGNQWAFGKSAIWIWIIVGLRSVLVVLRGDKHSRLQWGGEIWILLSALTVIVVGRQSSPFFGMTFAIALIWTGVSSFVYLMSRIPNLFLKLGLGLPLLIGTGWYNSIHHDTFTPAQPTIIDKRDSVVQKISTDIFENSGNEYSTVFVGFVGNINSSALQWTAQKAQWHQRYHAFDRIETLQDYISWLEQADYVVTAENGAPELMHYLPTVRECHVAFHEYMSQNAQFERLAYYDTYAGKGYYLFRRIGVIAAQSQ